MKLKVRLGGLRICRDGQKCGSLSYRKVSSAGPCPQNNFESPDDEITY